MIDDKLYLVECLDCNWKWTKRGDVSNFKCSKCNSKNLNVCEAYIKKDACQIPTYILNRCEKCEG